MADKYWSVSLIAADQDLQQRVVACAAIENIFDPLTWAHAHAWDYASQPGWGEKWQYALDSGDTSPGRNDAVITDADILTAVQQIRAEDPLNEEEA